MPHAALDEGKHNGMRGGTLRHSGGAPGALHYLLVYVMQQHSATVANQINLLI